MVVSYPKSQHHEKHAVKANAKKRRRNYQMSKYCEVINFPSGLNSWIAETFMMCVNVFYVVRNQFSASWIR